MLLISECVFDGEDSTPGLTVKEEVVAIQVKRTAYLFDLIDKPFELPELGLVGLITVV